MDIRCEECGKVLNSKNIVIKKKPETKHHEKREFYCKECAENV